MDALGDLHGHHWYDNGQSALWGDVLHLSRRLDRMFLAWAGDCGADDYEFPPLLPAAALAKLDYFRSFPHLVTFPMALAPGDANLRAFTAGEPFVDGAVRMTECSPVRDVLTPAACYHFYVLFQGHRLIAPRVVTTRATCFRREQYFAPLEREWAFPMREIVCLGSLAEVQTFLDALRARVDAFFRRIALPVQWKAATDPFFNPRSNPKFIAQKVAPLKTEMVFQDRLAIGSVNFHRTYFGDSFDIVRGGEAAHSGCVAFGLDRWLHAFVTQFGASGRDWPVLDGEGSADVGP